MNRNPGPGDDVTQPPPNCNQHFDPRCDDYVKHVEQERADWEALMDDVNWVGHPSHY